MWKWLIPELTTDSPVLPAVNSMVQQNFFRAVNDGNVQVVKQIIQDVQELNVRALDKVIQTSWGKKEQ